MSKTCVKEVKNRSEKEKINKLQLINSIGFFKYYHVLSVTYSNTLRMYLYKKAISDSNIKLSLSIRHFPHSLNSDYRISRGHYVTAVFFQNTASAAEH